MTIEPWNHRTIEPKISNEIAQKYGLLPADARQQLRNVYAPGEIFLKPDSTVKCLIPQFIILFQFLRRLGMCSRKNEREVVFAKRRISTAYRLVAVIAVLHFLLERLRLSIFRERVVADQCTV